MMVNSPAADGNAFCRLAQEIILCRLRLKIRGAAFTPLQLPSRQEPFNLNGDAEAG